MTQAKWTDIGALEGLSAQPVSRVRIDGTALAVTFKDGVFGVVSNACNHVGGPLGEGRLDGDYVVCPWHGWKYHRCSGQGEPGSETDFVPSYPVKVENGRVMVDLANATPRVKTPHAPHPLARPVTRAPGPLRLLGLSTTANHLIVLNGIITTTCGTILSSARWYHVIRWRPLHPDCQVV